MVSMFADGGAEKNAQERALNQVGRYRGMLRTLKAHGYVRLVPVHGSTLASAACNSLALGVFDSDTDAAKVRTIGEHQRVLASSLSHIDARNFRRIVGEGHLERHKIVSGPTFRICSCGE